MKRYLALGAVLAALGVGGTALVQGATAGGVTARAAQSNGGLSISPALIQSGPTPGGLATVTIANRSLTALAVTVTPRKWNQAADGGVAPNRRGTLPGISVSQSSLTLTPGQEAQVAVTLSSVPSAGYLYGALEVTGVPTDLNKRKGVVLGYRVIGAIRILPATPTYGITARNPKVAKKTAVIPVKNTGNTLDAVSGEVRVRGIRGTKTYELGATRILPGKTINLPAGSSLAKGSYTATVRLTQRGKRVVQATKKFKVK